MHVFTSCILKHCNILANLNRYPKIFVSSQFFKIQLRHLRRLSTRLHTANFPHCKFQKILCGFFTDLSAWCEWRAVHCPCIIIHRSAWTMHCMLVHGQCTGVQCSALSIHWRAVQCMDNALHVTALHVSAWTMH